MSNDTIKDETGTPIPTPTDDAATEAERRRQERYFTPGRRRPRYRQVEGRRSEASRAGMFAMTPRDLDIIEAIARHRFLDADQLGRLFEEGRTRRRLTELFHKGLIARPLRQRDMKIRDGALMPGSIPMVYALDAEGARVLIERGRMPAGRRNWTRDNTEAGALYIGHTLATANLRIALDEAVKKRPGMTVSHDRELAATIPRDYAKHPGRPFAMTVPVIHEDTRIELAVDCDAAFMLDDTTNRRRAHFLVEVDLDTMPIVRRKRGGAISFKGTSMMRKFIAYERAHELELHKELFGWAGFRVVIVTTSATHARNMATAIATMNGGRGSRLFLIADAAATSGDILAHPFIDCWGNAKTLID